MSADPAALLRHVLAELTQIGRDVRTIAEAATLHSSALAQTVFISANIAMDRIAALVVLVAPIEQAATVDNGVLATVNARLADLAERVERLEGERRERMLRRAQADAHEAHDHG